MQIIGDICYFKICVNLQFGQPIYLNNFNLLSHLFFFFSRLLKKSMMHLLIVLNMKYEKQKKISEWYKNKSKKKKRYHSTSLRKNNQELSHSEQVPSGSTTHIYMENIYIDTIHLHCSMRYYPETNIVYVQTRRLSIKTPTSCIYNTRVTATVTVSLTSLDVRRIRTGCGTVLSNVSCLNK